LFKIAADLHLLPINNLIVVWILKGLLYKFNLEFMSRQGTIRRYTLIIEKMGRKQFPSFEVIKEYLYEHGFDISKRTLQRDIEQIRVEFGMEIRYDRSRNGYFIDIEESFEPDSFLRFLEIVNTAELLTESLRESKDSLRFISLESSGNLKGVENLKPLLFAIRNCRIVVFIHENFDSGKQQQYTLRPYLLKEYQNRWYLIGTLGGTGKFRTFGIDRILNLELRDETFKRESGVDPVDLFENTIGLTYSQHEPVEVVLAFTPLQARYVMTLPPHQSQKVIGENEKEVLFSLRVVPNYEFMQRILMYGNTVKVMQPEWLVDDIRESLTDALKNYS
jgi:predicted DNA-binding transcriptional regulator YafY